MEIYRLPIVMMGMSDAFDLQPELHIIHIWSTTWI
jgi:hypothetical protein